jgi:hypothetical protein
MRVIVLISVILFCATSLLAGDIDPAWKAATGSAALANVSYDSLPSDTTDTTYTPILNGETIKCKALASWGYDSGYVDLHFVGNAPRVYSKIFIKGKSIVYVLFDKIRKGLNTTAHLDSLTLYPR